MYKETIKRKVIQTIGEYTIVKIKEQTYFEDGTKFGKADIVYDICINGSGGDIVHYCNTLRDARKWAKEH